MTGTVRTVVIGGGIMGASTLYHLAKLGWTDSVLLEKSDLTHGSTWHAAGLCTHFAHNATIMQMRADSIRQYRSELEQDTGMSVGFNKTGALRVTQVPDRMDEFRHVQGIGRFMEQEFHIVTPSEIKELHPLVDIDKLIGGIYEPNDGNVDPSQATQALAAGARSRGARIFRNSPVTAIERTRTREWRVITPSTEYLCEHVVNAAGTWCREIGEMMGVDLPVVPILHQYFVTADLTEAFETQLPIVRDPDESWYVRQERNGLIFGPYEKNPEPWAIDGIPPEFGAELLPPNLDRVASIIDLAVNRFPTLGTLGIKQIVNGPITFTPDANPLIGPVFGLSNSWLITGSSMGVMEGGGAGRFIAEWMVGGEAPMDPTTVDSRRFGSYADRKYRIAKAVESYEHQFNIHYPREERPAARGSLKSNIHQSLESVGAVFGQVFGWERPNWFRSNDSAPKAVDSFRRTNWFESVAKECRLVAENVGISDLSAMAKFEVSGVDAEFFMEALGSNRPPRRIGHVSLVHVLNHAGGVLSEFMVLRRAYDKFYLTSAAAAAHIDLELLRSRAAELRVKVKPVTEERCVIGLMGPQAKSLMMELTENDLSQEAFPWLSGQNILLAGKQVLAIRISYVGESGWELHIPKSNSTAIFSALKESGLEYGLGLFGAFAIDSMRLEKGYRAWGLDLTTERTPIEAGLDHLARLENRVFIGRESLLRRKHSEDSWCMKLLELETDGVVDPFYLHPVYQGKCVVGIVTSGAYGHRTRKSLALAYFTKPGLVENNQFEVEIIGKRYAATVLSNPPYDPTNSRLRSSEHIGPSIRKASG